MDQYTNFSQGGFDPSHGLTSMEMLGMIPSNHHQIHHHHHPLSFDLRDGFFVAKPDFYQNPAPHQPQISKYLIPAKELLDEFCSLGGISATPKGKKPCNVDGGSSSSSSLNHQALSTLDPFELQTRKSRLLSMLEEVDRRYARYCEQMRSTVSSFEAAAGEGAATAYSKSAATAMSRHFRSLRDGIEVQVRATSKAMGEKEPGTRGETPRLRMLEERIRRQKAMQQASAMESHPWRPQRGLPERSVSVLRAWLFEHFLHPYPSDVDKHILARQTGLSRSQVSNWFINARVRLWKPMVEEMYMEETKEQDEAVAADEDHNSSNQNPNPNPNSSISHDEKMINDPGSLASVVNSSQLREYPTAGGSFMLLDQMDFAPYDRSFGGVGGGGGGGGVSLTLGLQQHGGGGMSLSFSPATDEQSLFFARENIGDWDGDHQNLPYRNLMGTAPLLHDLAG